MQHIRGNKISMIFQEPMTALNPVYTVGDQIAEVILLHELFSEKDQKIPGIMYGKNGKVKRPSRKKHSKKQ